MRILGVDVAPTFHVEAPQDRVAELQREIEEREDSDALLAQKEEALQARQEFLTKLSQASAGSLARGIALGKAEISAGAEVISFVDDNLSSTGQEMQEVTRQRREVARELEKLHQELEQLQATRPLERRRVVVSVEAMEEGELELEVSYLVKGARWQPLYDLRLLGDQGQVELTYLASVSQQSGEDWKDVVLTLSTARPALSSVMPELEPWFIKERKPLRPLRPTAKDMRGLMAAAEPMMAEAVPSADMMDVVLSREERLREPFVEAEAVCNLLRSEKIPCWVFTQSPAGIVGFYHFLANRPGLRFVMVPKSWEDQARRTIEEILPKLELLPSDEPGSSECDEPTDELDVDGQTDR